MIMWLASYPKSGNTWVRALLSSYLFEKYYTQNEDIFTKMKLISSFPVASAFEKIVDKELIKKNKLEAFKYFIKAQERINKDPKLHIIKTHNFCGSTNGYEFTNKENTIGSIYIVRDPRSVAVSYASFANISLEKSVELMMNENRIGYNNKYYPEARLSWKTHFLSWLNSPYSKLLIKYEDMLKDTHTILKSSLTFINTLINNKIGIDESKILKVVEECRFDNLKNLENKIGFGEKKIDSTNFFRKGTKSEWQKVLPQKLINKIEDHFSSEMKKLNYI